MIWVTGAGGMIGSHMMEYFTERGEAVFGTFYRPTTDITELGDNVDLQECDIRDGARVNALVCSRKPSVVFHLAAQSFPAVSWEEPNETMETNAGGTINIFEAVKHVREADPGYDPMVVVACSSAEYGSSLDGLDAPVKEDAPLLPLHPYGVSKVAQDLLAYQYYVNDRIRCIRARLFNTTGTRKRGDVSSDLVQRIIEQERSAPFSAVELRVGNTSTYRAILDVRDTVRALALLAELGTPGCAYNISSTKTYQVKQIIETLENIVGKPFELRVDPLLLRPSDEHAIVGDAELLMRETGWKQEIALVETLTDMLQYWRAKS